MKHVQNIEDLQDDFIALVMELKELDEEAFRIHFKRIGTLKNQVNSVKEYIDYGFEDDFVQDVVDGIDIMANKFYLDVLEEVRDIHLEQARLERLKKHTQQSEGEKAHG